MGKKEKKIFFGWKSKSSYLNKQFYGRSKENTENDQLFFF